MLDRSGRYIIVFNGEIYNYLSLKRMLQQRGVTFTTESDTEVLLYALITWSTRALDLINGMYSLAFYDKHEKSILIARDHAGIKPLYYMTSGKGLVFASQFDQILEHPWSQNLCVDKGGMLLYLKLGYIPAPHSILENVKMFEAGTWLKVNADGKIEKGRFFDIPKDPGKHSDYNSLLEELDSTLSGSIKNHMVSDAPLGAFLSGGIDSPLVCLKAFSADNNIKAFTMGVKNYDLDESADAAKYAEGIGISHKIEYIKEEEMISLLSDVIEASSEPFADYSIFPTLLITRYAKRDVKVMLSGDGGDELFWGYSRRMGSVIGSAHYFKEPSLLRQARWGVKKYLHIGNVSRNILFPTIGDWYLAKHARLNDTLIKNIFGGELSLPEDFSLYSFSGTDPDHAAEWVRWNEFMGHLTMVLLKVDRASMYNSLEVRVPLLDKEVIKAAFKFCWQDCLDIKNYMGKKPLRDILSKHLPFQTVEKRGFNAPMAEWLRGPFKDVFREEFWSRKTLLGFSINRTAILDSFNKHLSAKQDLSWPLWCLLSLALWEKRYFKR